MELRRGETQDECFRVPLHMNDQPLICISINIVAAFHSERMLSRYTAHSL